MMEVVIIMASYNSEKLINHMMILLDYSKTNNDFQVTKKFGSFLKKLIIHFLRVEIEPRLWYLNPMTQMWVSFSLNFSTIYKCCLRVFFCSLMEYKIHLL